MILERFSQSGRELIAAPAWEDVERFFASLDGEMHCDAFLGNDQTEGVWVAGGPERFLVSVQAFDPDGPGLVIDEAIDPTGGLETVSVVLSNGQWDEYPRRQTVDRATLLRVSRRYFLDGGLDTDTTWAQMVTA